MNKQQRLEWEEEIYLLQKDKVLLEFKNDMRIANNFGDYRWRFQQQEIARASAVQAIEEIKTNYFEKIEKVKRGEKL